jgi:predicted phage terminase large subunit-like protein
MSQEFDPRRDLHQALLSEDSCAAHGPLRICDSYEEADWWNEAVKNCSPAAQVEHLRWLARNDLYFLLVHLLNNTVMAGYWPGERKRSPLAAQWFYDRTKEVELEPNGFCDQWSRGAGKSTIITYAKTIQDILVDPEQTFCILSHTRPIAKAFLSQIKIEFEQNERLKELFPDILYQDPEKESIRWTLDDGIVVKRKGNPRESTLAAFGLVDSMPTGHHYSMLIYDDVVTEKAITTPDMIEKVQRALDLSINLGATRPIRFRMIGTPYAVGDPYDVSMERGFAKPRIRPAIVENESMLWDEAGVAQLKQSMSPRMFALQILMDRKQASEERGFRQEWLKHWSVVPNHKSMNRYIFVDPGGKGQESTSYTAIVVVGLAPDKHIYVLDMVKDRLSLVDRISAVFQMHRKYEPLTVFYERYSMQSDIESIRVRMGAENYHFNIEEVGALSNKLSKERRIEMIQPEFSNGLILLPPLGSIKRLMHDGKEAEMVENFIHREYLPFPFSRESDFLDALSRLKDDRVRGVLVYPRAYGSSETGSAWGQSEASDGSWMAS